MFLELQTEHRNRDVGDRDRARQARNVDFALVLASEMAAEGNDRPHPLLPHVSKAHRRDPEAPEV